MRMQGLRIKRRVLGIGITTQGNDTGNHAKEFRTWVDPHCLPPSAKQSTGRNRKGSGVTMDNEYTTAAKQMIDDAVQDRDNGVITLAEFYRICSAAVEIFGRQPAKTIYEAGA